LWREVFTPDATLDYGTGGFGKGTYVELADWMRGDGPDGRMYEFTRWQHLLGLPTVTIDGDTATARTDMLVSHKAKPDDDAEHDPNWYVTSAFALHDNLVRTADGWRISVRRLEVLQAAPQEPGPAHTATPTTPTSTSRCAEPSQNVAIRHAWAHQARSEFPGEAMELKPVSPTAEP
jgi:SnoaL-like domain